MRVAIFVEDSPELTADAQLSELRQFCHGRGWSDPVVWRDPPLRVVGEGGLSSRLRAIQGCLRRQHDVLCVWRLAALGARNLNGLVLTLAAILRAGVAVVAVGDGVDGTGDGAAALIRALASVECATNNRLGWVRPRDPCEGCPCRPRGKGKGRQNRPSKCQ
jgi:DNA invertase Pin-like site-specific DNA recombinase